MIGDPSGKSKERQLLDEATIRNNEIGIKKNLEAIIDFHAARKNPAILVNNFDWFKNFSLITFLRDVGKLPCGSHASQGQRADQAEL